MSDNQLILHLKYKYFDMVECGEKFVEYREFKPYWISRIHMQTKLTLVPGYNLDNCWDLDADITRIHVVSFDSLPDYVRVEFKGKEKSEFFAIEFNNVREV